VLVADERDERGGDEVERGDDDVDGRGAEAIQRATERRARDAGHLARRRHAGDRARDQRVRDEPRHQRRAGRVLERARGADDRHHGEHAVAAQPAAEGAERERGRRSGFGHVAGHHDEAAIAAVRDVSAHERQEDGRDELDEAHQPEIERAAGEGVELPAHRNGLHVEREHRRNPRAPEQREGSISQEPWDVE